MLVSIVPRQGWLACTQQAICRPPRVPVRNQCKVVAWRARMLVPVSSWVRVGCRRGGEGGVQSSCSATPSPKGTKGSRQGNILNHSDLTGAAAPPPLSLLRPPFPLAFFFPFILLLLLLRTRTPTWPTSGPDEPGWARATRLGQAGLGQRPNSAGRDSARARLGPAGLGRSRDSAGPGTRPDQTRPGPDSAR